MADVEPAGGSPGQRPGAAAARAEKRSGRKRGRPALLARFPKLFWHPAIDDDWNSDWLVIDPAEASQYGQQLTDDLRVWDRLLKTRFRRLDHTAQVLQNQFWLQNVALVIGGLLATSLGAVQAVLGGGVKSIAVVQAVLTGVLAGLTVIIRSRRAQQGYLAARLKAERIKSEFFLFLARAREYAGAGRETALRQQVDDIEAAESAP